MRAHRLIRDREQSAALAFGPSLGDSAELALAHPTFARAGLVTFTTALGLVLGIGSGHETPEEEEQVMESHSSDRQWTTRRPNATLRVGMAGRLSLWLNARHDARCGIPTVDSSLETRVDAPDTPVIARLVSTAAEFADLEKLRLSLDTTEARSRLVALTQRRQVLADQDARLAASADQGSVAVERRRLARRIAEIDRATPPLMATIDARFDLARLAVVRHVDYTERMIAHYWTTLRRRHPFRDALPESPPRADRPDWLTASDGVAALDLDLAALYTPLAAATQEGHR